LKTPTALEVITLILAVWGSVLSSWVFFTNLRRRFPQPKFYYDETCPVTEDEFDRWRYFAVRIVNPRSRDRITIDEIQLDTDHEGVGMVSDLKMYEKIIWAWAPFKCHTERDCDYLEKKKREPEFPIDLEPGTSVAFTITVSPNLSLRIGVTDGEGRQHCTSSPYPVLRDRTDLFRLEGWKTEAWMDCVSS